MLLSETVVHISSTKVKPVLTDSNTLELNYKLGTPISIYVYNTQGKRLLQETDFYFAEKDRDMKLYIGHLKERGVKSVYIQIGDHNNKLSQTKRYQF